MAAVHMTSLATSIRSGILWLFCKSKFYHVTETNHFKWTITNCYTSSTLSFLGQT